jgi:hypothetical protein
VATYLLVKDLTKLHLVCKGWEELLTNSGFYRKVQQLTGGPS